MENQFEISKCQFFDMIVYSLIAIGIINFVLGLNYSSANETVITLFFVIGIYSFLKSVKTDANIDIKRNFYIFEFIFFFLAPLQQYTEGVRLWSSTGLRVSYSDSDYIRALLAIILMMLMFELGLHSKRFVLFKGSRITEDKIIVDKIVEDEPESLYLKDSTCMILTCISTLSFLFLMVTNNISQTNNIFGASSLAVQLLNIIKYFPVCSLLMAMMYAKNYGTEGKKIYYIVMGFEVIVIFAPIWGNLARFILFGTYIVFLAFFLHDYKLKSLYFLGLVLGFCFAFSSLRHTTAPFAFLQSITIDFSHVDFDAFQIFMAAQKYINENGVLLFKNIFSALAFLIPRTLWSGKLEGTGTLIVRYFGSWQENVSSPLIAEMYMAGSWPGIVILSFIVGKVVRRIDKLRVSDNYMKQAIFCLVTGMSIYIYRGSLLAAFAYTGGLILSLLFIYLICKIR